MEDTGKLILRITMAGLILFHGISKIMHGVAFMGGALEQFHLPAFIAYGVYVGEVVAPLFIIVGLWTRISALVVVFNMVMAIVLEAHRNAFVIQRTGAWGLDRSVLPSDRPGHLLHRCREVQRNAGKGHPGLGARVALAILVPAGTALDIALRTMLPVFFLDNEQGRR